MNRNFKIYANKMEAYFERLLDCPAKSICDGKALPEVAGVYLISEKKRRLYVGRTNNIRRRMAHHRGSSPTSSTFAFALAALKIGWRPTYTKDRGRDWISKQPRFKKAFQNNIQRIRGMTVQYVEVEKAETQYLLEFYVHVACKTPHNLWATH